MGSADRDGALTTPPPNPKQPGKLETSFVDATRLSQGKRAELLKTLDRASAGRKDSRRKNDRYEYQVHSLPATILLEGGGESKVLMHGRNISTGGLALLHGGYLHNGTQVRVLLKTQQTVDKLVLGRVVACRHIAKNIHEISLQFYDKIDVSDFCGPGAKVVSTLKAAVHVPKFTGLALCYCKDKAERAVLGGWLSMTGLSVAETSTIGSTIDRLKRLPVVVALIDVGDDHETPEQIIKSLRDAGFGRTILALTPDERPVPGADAEVRRPLDMSALMKILVTTCRVEALLDHEPIYSSMASNPGAAELLSGYVKQLGSLAAQIEDAVQTDRAASAKQACQNIRSTASGYGFASLGDAAGQAMLALDVSKTPKACARHLMLLASLCKRATAGMPSSRKTGDAAA